METSVVRLPTHGGAEEHKGSDHAGGKECRVARAGSPERDEDRGGQQEKDRVVQISGEDFRAGSARNIEGVEFAGVALLDHCGIVGVNANGANEFSKNSGGPGINFVIGRFEVQGGTAKNVASDVAHTEFGIGEVPPALFVRVAVWGSESERRSAETNIAVKLRTIEGQ